MDDVDLKWRYQLINYGTDDKPDLKMHEVYFNASSGKIEGWTENPYQISGYENAQEIVEDLEMILKAIQRNVVVSIKDLISK
jgi:hypothetical protein